jgi:Family of unknown function (DUF6252)
LTLQKPKFLLLTLVIAISILSCEKDDAEPSEIKFKIDGIEHSYSGEADRSTLHTNNEFIGEYAVSITYDDWKNDFRISLDIWRFEDEIAEYFISTNNNRSYNPNIKIDDEYFRGEDTGVGSITITELTNDRIKGEFDFKAKSDSNNVVIITEGFFDVPYNPNVDED